MIASDGHPTTMLLKPSTSIVYVVAPDSDKLNSASNHFTPKQTHLMRHSSYVYRDTLTARVLSLAAKLAHQVFQAK